MLSLSLCTLLGHVQLLNTGSEQRADKVNSLLASLDVIDVLQTLLLNRAKRGRSTKVARGIHEFPPDLELASALELCNTISNVPEMVEEYVQQKVELKCVFN